MCGWEPYRPHIVVTDSVFVCKHCRSVGYSASSPDGLQTPGTLRHKRRLALEIPRYRRRFWIAGGPGHRARIPPSRFRNSTGIRPRKGPLSGSARIGNFLRRARIPRLRTVRRRTSAFVIAPPGISIRVPGFASSSSDGHTRGRATSGLLLLLLLLRSRYKEPASGGRKN